MKPTADDIRSWLQYNPDTGEFTWKVNRGVHKLAGHAAGCINRNRLKIKVNSKLYPASHIAWVYMTGEWPSLVDHIDLNSLNNKWTNLRLATKSQNAANSRIDRKNNKSGIKGVRFDKDRGIWRSQITFYGESKHLGCFASKSAAVAAYNKAAVAIFGEYARTA